MPGPAAAAAAAGAGVAAADAAAGTRHLPSWEGSVAAAVGAVEALPGPAGATVGPLRPTAMREVRKVHKK